MRLIAARGIPCPYLITPRTGEEAHTGKATLIARGDLDVLIEALMVTMPDETDLIEKLTRLRAG